MGEGGEDLLGALAQALGRHGLILRGQPIRDSARAVSIVLVGQAGQAAWHHFRAWHEDHPDIPDPLDTWSRAVIGEVAERFGACAVSPSDRPFLPFQQWAMQAEGLRASPLGILMHPVYGLWHAYRGALLFDRPFADQPEPASPHLCATCEAKPCLSACPVRAYSSQGFDYDRCQDFLGADPGAACLGGGCAPRDACPYGREFRYAPEQITFHMRSFARQ